MTTTADPLSASFITMSSRFWRLYNALRSDLLRLSCFGLGGMCDLTADSTRFTNASRSQPCLGGRGQKFRPLESRDFSDSLSFFNGVSELNLKTKQTQTLLMMYSQRQTSTKVSCIIAYTLSVPRN